MVSVYVYLTVLRVCENCCLATLLTGKGTGKGEYCSAMGAVVWVQCFSLSAMGAVVWVQCFSPRSHVGSGLGAVLLTTQPWGQWFGCSTIDHSAMGAVVWVQCFSPRSHGGSGLDAVL